MEYLILYFFYEYLKKSYLSPKFWTLLAMSVYLLTKNYIMQPNFTLKKLRLIGFQFFAIALMLCLSTQFSYSQERVISFPKESKTSSQKETKISSQKATVQKAASVQSRDAELRQAKLQYHNRTQANLSSDNDAGLPNRRVQANLPRTEAVCLTINGSLDAGDPTMGFRPWRDGVPSVCGPVKVCTPTGLTAAGTFYDVITFANPLATPQCITITFTNGAAAIANFVAVYQTPFVVPTAANGFCVANTFLGDAGSSPAASGTVTFDITLAGGQSADILVSSVGGSVPSTYTLQVEAPVCFTGPCSGTPAPGMTLPATSASCPGVPFALTLENATPGSGVTYQWESASASTGPWTPIPGATNPSLSTSITATTYYRAQVTCSGNTTASAPAVVNLNPPSACYCDAGATSTAFEKISRVEFKDIDNSSTSTAGYENFLTISTDIIAGESAPITVTIAGPFSSDQVLVWIDFNQNGSFTDPGEAVYVSPQGVGPHTGTITISPTALTGPTRMRVRMHDAALGGNPTSCGNSTYGQVEDYTVNILPCTPAIITSNPSNSSIACGSGTTFNVATAGNVSSYQWEKRGDPNALQTLTFTNNTPLPIPDNDGAGTYSTISVAGIPPGAVITDVSIRVNIDHTYVGDLENNIIAPNNVSLNLMAELDNGTGSNSSDNFTNTVISSTSTVPLSGAPAPRTGTFGADRRNGYGPSANFQTSPNGMPWSALYTQLNGDWKLGLSDWFAGDVGTLNNWSITFTFTAPTAWVNVVDGGIYSGATTPTLTLSNVSQAYSGDQYRAAINGICSGVDVSSAATLTVTPVIPVVDPASATICVGTIQQLTLTNTLSAEQTVSFSKTGLSTVLTNGIPAIVEDSVLVTGIPPGSVISNIEWGFNMTHTWASDVGHNVTSPSGENLNMLWQIGGSTDDFIGTYFDALSTDDISTAPAPRTGIFAPMALTITGGPVSFTTTTNDVNDMLAGDPNGYWKFAFYDAFGGDDGLLTDLFVKVTYTAPVFAQGTWTGPAGTMFTDATATTPYTGTPVQTIYVQPTVTSNYQVSFTSGTPCTSATTTVPITVIDPVSNVTNPANSAVCVGGTTSFTSTAGGGPFSRQWQVSIDGGVTWSNMSGQTGSTLTLSNVTQLMNNNRYRAVYTAAPCLGSTTSAAATLKVNKLPIVAITAPDLTLTPPSNGNTVVTATSDTAAAVNGWAWTLNGSTITGTTNTQNVGIDEIGTYQATVTDKNGCMGTSNELVIGSEPSDRLWIYPNPTDGQFQVRYYFQSDVINESRIVSIFNSVGQLITSKRFLLSFGTAPYIRMDFDLTSAAPGTYVVKVAHEYTGKVVSGLLIVH